jgi:hypothetical protein
VGSGGARWGQEGSGGVRNGQEGSGGTRKANDRKGKEEEKSECDLERLHCSLKIEIVPNRDTVVAVAAAAAQNYFLRCRLSQWNSRVKRFYHSEFNP